MTVKALIEQLQRFDPHLEVVAGRHSDQTAITNVRELVMFQGPFEGWYTREDYSSQPKGAVRVVHLTDTWGDI